MDAAGRIWNYLIVNTSKYWESFMPVTRGVIRFLLESSPMRAIVSCGPIPVNTSIASWNGFREFIKVGFYKRRCQEQTHLPNRSESSARHRALGGICRLSVWTWAETANIPVLVLSELRLHKLLGLDSQPWFYLRLKGLQVYWVVRGGIRRLSRKEKKNSYNGTDKSVPFPEPGREASCPSLTPAW